MKLTGSQQERIDKVTPRWYFDVASTSSTNESVVAVFWESPADGFPHYDPGTTLSTSLTGTFANGSILTSRFGSPATAMPSSRQTLKGPRLSGEIPDSDFKGRPGYRSTSSASKTRPQGQKATWSSSL